MDRRLIYILELKAFNASAQGISTLDAIPKFKKNWTRANSLAAHC
jgi:hypothetical protein